MRVAALFGSIFDFVLGLPGEILGDTDETSIASL